MSNSLTRFASLRHRVRWSQVGSIVRRPVAIALAILIVAWLVRVYALGADSLWADEVFSFNAASQPSWEAFRRTLDRDDHPPLSEWGILHPWLGLGTSDFLFRFPSAVFGTLTVGVVYALGRVAFDRRVGTLSALLLAISPLHVYHSREARMYAPLALLITLAIYCLFKALNRASGDGKYWLAYSLLGAASMYTHYYAAIVLLALAGFVLLRSIACSDTSLLAKWAAASAGTAALFVPWFPVVWSQLQSQPIPWLESAAVAELLQLPTHFFAKQQVLPTPIWLGATWAVWAALTFGAIAVIPARQSISNRRNSYAYIASSVGFTYLISILISLYKPLVYPRFFLGIVPATCILVAVGIVYFRPRFLAVSVAAVLLAVSLLSTYRICTSGWREDWKGVATYIETNSVRGDEILLFAPSEYWLLPFDHYYMGDASVTRSPGDLSEEQDITAALESLEPHNRTWLIQPARHLASRSLDYKVHDTYLNRQLLSRQVFDDGLGADHLAVDVWLLGPPTLEIR